MTSDEMKTGSTSERTALLIDDRERGIEGVRQYLLLRGYTVDYAKDFGEAIKFLEGSYYDLVTVDSRLNDELSNLDVFDHSVQGLLTLAKKATYRGAAYYLQMRPLFNRTARHVAFYTCLNQDELAEFEFQGERIPRSMIFCKYEDPGLNWLDALIRQV